MTTLHPDIVILGSGFGGSLLALILARAGKSVVMLDRGRHPRFAIGESSTPLADRTLAAMADRYMLPELRPLCHWGTWKRAYPDIRCGRKRGFTYLDQTGHSDMSVDNFDDRRLLVSASIDDEHSDTHWLRSDVDQLMFRLAEASSVTTLQQCVYYFHEASHEWRLQVVSSDAVQLSKSVRCTESDGIDTGLAIHAPFLIDATGSSNGVLKHLNVPDATHLLQTDSRAIFAHFESATTCEQLLTDHHIDVSTFPYRCDDAAVHQVLPDGWMWQLRYDDDSLSAGFMIDERARMFADDHQSHRTAGSFDNTTDEWNWRIERTPFLSRQFRHARIIRPDSGLQSTRRIQRLTSQAAGPNWATITNTAGFIDPLHSTGIAHTLFSISRLTDILLADDSDIVRSRRLQTYSDSLLSEIRCVDELVEGCYEAIPSFRLWSLWGMLYFAAATSMEQVPADNPGDASFLRADDQAFRAILQEGRQRLAKARHSSAEERPFAEQSFAKWLQSAIKPWNQVGLFDDHCNGLYSKTAAPANAW